MTRVFYREPVDGARRVGQPVLLHTIQEDPPNVGHCGVRVQDTSRMPTVVIDTMPVFLDVGLRWCPLCIGKLAHEAGMLDRVVRLLTTPAIDPGHDGEAVDLVVAQLRGCQQPAAADMLEALAARLAEAERLSFANGFEVARLVPFEVKARGWQKRAQETGRRIAAAIRARGAAPLGAGAMVAWHALEEAAQIAEADAADQPESWPLSVSCPACGAPERVWCFEAEKGGHNIGQVHPERRARAENARP